MKVKGLNKAYDVTIEKTNNGKVDGIVITAGNLMTGMTSVMISVKDWERIKKGV